MTRRNALSCRSARRNYRPASTCLRLFLNHPKQTASYPLALCFERETSHNQVLTRRALYAYKQPATSNSHFQQPQNSHPQAQPQPLAPTLASSRRQPQAGSQALAGTIFRPAGTLAGSHRHIFNTRTHNNLINRHSQAATGRPTGTRRQHPLTGKQPANDHFQLDRQCIWHSRTHLRLVHYFEIPQLERLAS